MKTIRYTEEQTLEAIGPLTRTRLHRMVEAECVAPQQEGDNAVFTEADVARLTLLCELRDDFDLDYDALPVVMNLLDQVHGLRRQLRMILRAIEEQPEHIRAQLHETTRQLGGPRD